MRSGRRARPIERSRPMRATCPPCWTSTGASARYFGIIILMYILIGELLLPFFRVCVFFPPCFDTTLRFSNEISQNIVRITVCVMDFVEWFQPLTWLFQIRKLWSYGCACLRENMVGHFSVHPGVVFMTWCKSPLIWLTLLRFFAFYVFKREFALSIDKMGVLVLLLSWELCQSIKYIHLCIP